ncbi:MAG: nascent polypeptide-associated complex protein [Candidatus Marsarchaeota archaeon]|nr:nascent polypeptide-associated complex protein [Candidatus Marsarchaeota archaeon]
MDPRALKRMMDSMGMKNTEIPADRVTISSADKDIVIEGASVTLIEMQGTKTFSISGGSVSEVDKARPEISEEDVKMVMEKTGADGEQARKALEESNGSIADAILRLS